MQRIVCMLVFQSAAPRSLDEVSPWFDMRAWGTVESVTALAEAQTHRRFFKTHLPLEALPIYEGVKFIHVARDGRDAAMSLHNHLYNFTLEARQRIDEVIHADPKFGQPSPPTPESPAAFFAEWVCDGGALGDPGASFFNVEKTYWNVRNEPNTLLIHFNDLKFDLGGEMRRVAEFLNIHIPDVLWPELIEAARFENMKADGDLLMPHARGVYDGGASRFLHKGTNGRWRDMCRPEDLKRYAAAVNEHFTTDLAIWLAGGRQMIGDTMGATMP